MQVPGPRRRSSMSAVRVVLATAALTLVLAPSAFAAKGFSYGVAAGDVTARSAILWGKANTSGRYTLQVRSGRVVQSYLVRARAGDDNTVQRKVTGLEPGTRYRYRFTGR